MIMTHNYKSPEVSIIIFEDNNSILCISAGVDRTIETMELED